MTDAPALTGTPPRGSSAATGWLLLPREHGAWSMLLLPFLSALALSATVSLTAIAALVAAVATFLLREPLTVLLRQRYVWKELRPETAAAYRSLIVLLPLLATMGVLLITGLPKAPVFVFGGAALVLTGAGAWVTIKNRQRSLAWQGLTATALSAGALFGAFSASGRLEPWCWILWLLFALHHLGAIFLVRARLETMISSRAAAAAAAAGGVANKARLARRGSLLAQVPLAVATAWFALSGRWPLTLPPLLSLLVHLWEWRTIEQTLARPLKQVGFRALAVSIGFAALTVVVLWPR